jgi:hypothetical protein
MGNNTTELQPNQKMILFLELNLFYFDVLGLYLIFCEFFESVKAGSIKIITFLTEKNDIFV